MTMKTAAVFSLILLLLCGCRKAQDDQETTVMLPLENREQAAADWNDFVKSADGELNAAQRKMDSLRDKIYLASARNKVNIRRVINKNEYILEKLRKELYDHNGWFESHIGSYTDENARKIEKFKTYFTKKIDGIKTEIDDCQC